MDTKNKLFEGVLTEFNWGQQLPQHRITNLNEYQPTVEYIEQEGALKSHIATYLNWCGGVAHSDKNNQTALFNSPNVLSKRNTIATALFNRLARERPNHPALIVLARDWEKELEKQKRTCIRLYFRSEPRQS